MNTDTTVAVVQARMGSTRLPGKVLAPIGPHPALGLLLRRLQRSTRIDQIVVATTTLTDDDPIVEEAAVHGVDVVRGPVDDVLARFVLVADRYRPSHIVRVTGDCPFTDPGLVDDLVDVLQSGPFDLVSNDSPTYLRGFDLEGLTVAALRLADASARHGHERVHVTPWLYSHPDRVPAHTVPWEGDHAHLRLTVDTPEDLEVVRGVAAAVPDAVQASWRDVVAVLELDPDLAARNRDVRQKRVEEG